MTKLKKKSVRILSFEHYLAHTTPLFSNLKILKIQDIFKLETLKFAFDFINSNLPEALHCLFTKSLSVHPHNTRATSNHNLYTPSYNTMFYGKLSLRFQAVSLWNNLCNQLSLDIDHLSRVSFSDKIKKYFIDCYSQDES